MPSPSMWSVKGLHNLTRVFTTFAPPTPSFSTLQPPPTLEPKRPTAALLLSADLFLLPCPACAGLLILHNSAIGRVVSGNLGSKAGTPGFQSQNLLVKVANLCESPITPLSKTEVKIATPRLLVHQHQWYFVSRLNVLIWFPYLL